MNSTGMEFDLGPTIGDIAENIITDIVKEIEDAYAGSTLVSIIDGRIIVDCVLDKVPETNFRAWAKTREDILLFMVKKLLEKLQETSEQIATAVNSRQKYLVDVLATCAQIDTSVARREIVMGEVTVNNKLITDPAATLIDEPGIVSAIGYRGKLYPFYP